MVQEKVVTLVYCKIDDQIIDIFTKALLKVKFIKFFTFLRLQEAMFMGGCPKVISPPESPQCCVDGEVLEHKSLLVHQISISSIDN